MREIYWESVLCIKVPTEIKIVIQNRVRENYGDRKISGCAKIKGAKIRGAKIKGARKFKGIRYVHSPNNHVVVGSNRVSQVKSKSKKQP